MRRALLGISVVAVALLVSGDQAPRKAAGEQDLRASLPGIEREIAAREYEATATALGLQAPNRAHGLRTYFDSTGIRVVDRIAAKAPELARLTLTGVGRGSSLAPVAPGEVTHTAARVEIRRAGLTEWYENKPEGLEQGFILAKHTEGDGELALEVVIGGAALSLASDAVFLRATAGRSLRYGGLRAEDARGHALEAHLELTAAHRVRLVVDDSNAEYPIAIDPLLTRSADTLLEGNQAKGASAMAPFFGTSVASAGDVNGDGYADLIVGAPGYDAGSFDSGAAFVFLGGPSGIASGGAGTASTTLVGAFDSNFGASVASAGDVNGDGYADVIVGASTYSEGLLHFEGAAYLFLGGPAGVSNASYFSAATILVGGQGQDAVTGLGGSFGTIVGSAGDVNGDGYSDVLVSAPLYTSSGAAFVFLGSASGVASGTASTAATRLDGAPEKDIQFPSSAASAGDVNGDGYSDVIAGDYQYGTDPNAPAGAAFIFLGGPSGVQNATTDTASTRLIGSTVPTWFGASVASAGDVNGDGYSDVIVGAPLYPGSAGGGGSVFVYLGGPSGVAHGTPLTANATLTCTVGNSDFGGYPAWGVGVAAIGDVNGDGYSDIAVMAPGYVKTSVSAPGHAVLFLFPGSANGISSGTELSAGVALDLPPFSGISMAGTGDVNGDGYDDLVVGVPDFSDPEQDEGAAFVFLGGAGIANASAAAASHTIASDGSGANLGTSVASAGDVNGDGYADVIVGAPYYDAGTFEEGAAFIFLGGAAGVSPNSSANAATILHSNQDSAHLGQSVASAGDVNGDGYADVIVGAPLYDSGESDEGAAFAFLGGPSGIASGIPATAAAMFQSNQAGARFGWSVASAGDVNGDGRADVVIGAPFYNTAFPLEGAAFVFLAGPTGLTSGSPATAAATIRANQSGATLGVSVAGAGDVNGDGFGDIVVGAPLFDGNRGAAAIFRGSATGITGGTLSAASTLIEGSQANYTLGWSVAGLGDVNGDGFDDIAAGAALYPAGSGPGAAFVFAGGASMPATATSDSCLVQIADDSGDTRFGTSVAGAGDVNGDGFADLVVGGASPTASAWLFYGGSSPVATRTTSTADRRLDGEDASSSFGVSAACAGDVNGDGVADLIVGSPTEHTPGQEGYAYLFYGWNEPGRSVAPRQLRGDGSSILVPPGGDSLGSGFAVRLLASHPAGLGRVRAEVQACPVGAAFGSLSCTDSKSASWVTVTPLAPSAVLAAAIPGPGSAARMHWRARVLYADATGPLPTNPAHGPWRRQFGLARGTDIRTSGTSADTDLDGIADSIDDCRFRSNPTQQDTGGLGSASAPDGIGDACQCGNVAGDGRVAADDVVAYRQSLANPAAALSADAQSRCVVFGSGTTCNILQVSVIRRAIATPPLPPVTSAAAAQVCAATQP